MTNPTGIEAIRLVAEHYGMPLEKAIKLMRAPLHPETLRDQLAMSASEKDIEQFLPYVLDVEKVTERAGVKSVTYCKPDHARQIARYLYADAMLEERIR